MASEGAKARPQRRKISLPWFRRNAPASRLSRQHTIDTPEAFVDYMRKLNVDNSPPVRFGCFAVRCLSISRMLDFRGDPRRRRFTLILSVAFFLVGLFVLVFSYCRFLEEFPSSEERWSIVLLGFRLVCLMMVFFFEIEIEKFWVRRLRLEWVDFPFRLNISIMRDADYVKCHRLYSILCKPFDGQRLFSISLELDRFRRVQSALSRIW